MEPKGIVRALIIGAVFLLFVAAAGAKNDPGEKKTIQFDGYDRVYYIHLPAGYDGQTPVPLVLGLHGGGGTAHKFDKLAHLNATADAHGFIAVYPQGLDKGWNDGRKADLRKHNADDVKFLSELCKQLTAEYAVDTNRTYSVGISNGAMMSYRLAADCPDVFAAVAGVVGGVTEDLVADHPPKAPIPVMMVVGDEDPIVPFLGGEIELFGSRRGKILPQREGARWWAAKNGAAETPVVTELPDADPNDGCRVFTEEYKSGAGYDVTSVVVRHGGHTWPSGWQYLGERIVGKTTRDIDNEIIWKFLAAHAKK